MGGEDIDKIINKKNFNEKKSNLLFAKIQPQVHVFSCALALTY